MFFMTKKKFEEEVRSRVEKEIIRMEENRYRMDELREIHNRIGRLEMRLEKVEIKCDITTNLHDANCIHPK